MTTKLISLQSYGDNFFEREKIHLKKQKNLKKKILID